MANPQLVKDLIDAGIHFGHRQSRWNPKMKPFIYGKRNLIHIIDVRETLKGFDIVLYSGVIGPARMSSDVVARLNKELARMVTTPAIREAWARQGADPITMTPDQVTAHRKHRVI